MMYAAAPQVQYVQAPMTYAAAPTMTYLQQQPMQYVNQQGQPCTADGIPLQAEQQYVNQQGQPCTADGMPLQMEQQYVNQQGQPCTADGQLFPAGASMQVAQPMYGAPMQSTAMNISPEIFAKLAQGGALTPEEMAVIQG